MGSKVLSPIVLKTWLVTQRRDEKNQLSLAVKYLNCLQVSHSLIGRWKFCRYIFEMTRTKDCGMGS